MSRFTFLILSFHFFEKLLYFTIVPNAPISAFNSGGLTIAGLALYFLVQTVTYRTVPAWGGYLADRKSPALGLLAGFVMEMIGLGTIAQSQALTPLLIGAVFTGIGGGLLNPAIQTMLARDRNSNGETLNFSYHYFLINIGALLGPILVWPFLGAEVLWFGVIPAAFALILAPQFRERFVQDQNAPASEKSDLLFLASITVLFKDRKFLQVFTLCAVYWGGYTMLFSSIPAISKELGRDFSGNIWLALNAGTVTLAHFWSSRLLKGRSFGWNLILTGMFLSVVGIILAGLAKSLAVLAIAVVVLSLGELLATPSLYGYMAYIAPKGMRAMYLGFIWVAGALGEGGGQALLGLDQNPRFNCLVMGAALLVVIALSTVPKTATRLAETYLK